ncbi:IS1634 family transposase, partial [Mycoplasmopsis pullorum]
LEDIKPLAKRIDKNLDKLAAKELFFKFLESNSVKTNVKNLGVEKVYKFLKQLEIFNCLPETKHKSLEEVLEFFIATRIINPRSYFCQYNNKSDYINDIKVQKSSIYNYLDVLLENKNEILINLHKKMQIMSDRNEKLLHFDNTTVYFESFTNNGLKSKGFSKDGKHNEDQIVIAMAVDGNGIPFHYKIYPGNQADSKTLITFLVEVMKIYKIENITVISDRGISNNANIRFLEQKGFRYIFQKRIDTLNQESKEFIVEDKGYEIHDGIFAKSRLVNSVWDKKRETGQRKQIVYFSPSKQTLDRIKRENFISKINKKRINGEIPLSDLVPEYKKKFMDVEGKTVGKLNYNKIKKIADQDGFYMIETNILDLSPKKAHDIYKEQWKIEDNFRVLKSSIEIRPMFVYKKSHIEAHVFLCFLALVVIKYILYKLRKFYFDNGEIQKITINMLIDSLKLITRSQKIINDKVEFQIVNNLDPNHSELNKIYKDLDYIL